MTWKLIENIPKSIREYAAVRPASAQSRRHSFVGFDRLDSSVKRLQNLVKSPNYLVDLEMVVGSYFHTTMN